MSESEIFLEYTGPVDYKIIDRILRKFKNNPDFTKLSKPTGKRTYSILVECLENIAKHSVKSTSDDFRMEPYISVRKIKDKIIIKSGNPVTIEHTEELTRRLNQINCLNDRALNVLFDKKINKELKQEENGAGLGFMIMKLKSGNHINYTFTSIDADHTFFEIKITINEYTMRKLIIENTSSSPKVIFDPEMKIFEISGESRPPDVTAFYDEILRWMDDYSQHLIRTPDSKDPVVFNLDFEYFNSSSAKYILDFCKQIGNVRSKGKNVEIKWHYEDEDIDMLEVGREMSRMAKFPFEYIRKEN